MQNTGRAQPIRSQQVPFRLALLTLLSSLLLGACSSNPPVPDNLLAEADSRIQAAEEAEAGREAPVALRTARDQVNYARSSMREEDYTQARQQLEKAIVNADYAIMKSRSLQMQQAAEEVQETIDALRTELDEQS